MLAIYKLAPNSAPFTSYSARVTKSGDIRTSIIYKFAFSTPKECLVSLARQKEYYMYISNYIDTSCYFPVAMQFSCCRVIFSKSHSHPCDYLHLECVQSVAKAVKRLKSSYGET